MHGIFLNTGIFEKKTNIRMIDMQLRAYLRTLTNKPTQYK